MAALPMLGLLLSSRMTPQPPQLQLRQSQQLRVKLHQFTTLATQNLPGARQAKQRVRFLPGLTLPTAVARKPLGALGFMTILLAEVQSLIPER
jgi:hypothetical protein